MNTIMASDHFPCAVVLVCGKRKSGKDYIVGRLKEMYVRNEVLHLSRRIHHVDARHSSTPYRLTQELCHVLTLSSPLKKQYAKVSVEVIK